MPCQHTVTFHLNPTTIFLLHQTFDDILPSRQSPQSSPALGRHIATCRPSQTTMVFRLGVCSIGEYSYDIFAASTCDSRSPVPIYESPLVHGPTPYSGPSYGMLSMYPFSILARHRRDFRLDLTHYVERRSTCSIIGYLRMLVHCRQPFRFDRYEFPPFQS